MGNLIPISRRYGGGLNRRQYGLGKVLAMVSVLAVGMAGVSMSCVDVSVIRNLLLLHKCKGI